MTPDTEKQMTPLSELIKTLNHSLIKPENDYDRFYNRGIKKALDEANLLLPKEKEGIINAAIFGKKSMDRNIRPGDYKTADDYFSSTYQETVNKK